MDETQDVGSERHDAPTHDSERLAGASPGGLRLGSIVDGRYTLLRLLGRGAMGVVYQARDDRAAGREVAIKVLVAGGEVSQERFSREGAITASLVHPSILRVHSYGFSSAGPYLVYELVEGARTLEDALPPLGLRERVELIRDAARGLAFAHSQGVIHRDVKPGNLLVDGDGRLRVADFGLAMAVGLERLTRSGAFVGTPLYMAPEQVRGEPPAPTVDVWALGVVLYEALCGEVPFPASNLQQLMGDLMAATRAPSPRQVNATVPVILDVVCQRALALDARRRYPDAEGLADDLQAWLDGEPVSATSASRIGLPLPARSLLLWGLPALAVLLLLAVALGGGGGHTTPNGPASSRSMPAPTPESADAGERWNAIRELKDPSERLRAIEAWLHDHPQHALRERVLAQRQRVVQQIPLWRLPQPGLVGACYLEGDRVLTWGTGLRCWTLPSGEHEAWAASSIPCLATSAGLVAFAERFTLRVWRADRSVVFERSYRDQKTPPNQLPVSALALSRDARRVAVGGHMQEIQVLSIPDGKVLVRLPRGAPVSALRFTPDGDRLLVTEADSTDASPTQRLRVVDVASGSDVSYTTSRRPLSLATSADGRYVVVGDATGGITRFRLSGQLLDERADLLRPSRMRSPSRLVTLAHLSRVNGLAFTGSTLLSASGSFQGRTPADHNDVMVWDVPSGAFLGLGLETKDLYCSLDLSPAGPLLGVYAQEAQLWHPQAVPALGKVLERRANPEARWEALLATADQSARLREAKILRADFSAHPLRERVEPVYRKLAAAVPLRVLKHPGNTGSCFLDPLGRRALTWSEGNRALGLLCWDLSLGTSTPWIENQALRHVAVAPSARVVAACGPGGRRIALDADGRILRDRVLGSQPAKAGRPTLETIAISPDGRFVAAGGWDREVHLLDLLGEREWSWPRPDTAVPVRALAFSQNGETLAVGEGSPNLPREFSRLRIVDPQTGGALHELRFPVTPNHLLALPSERWLLGGNDGGVYRFEADLSADPSPLRGAGGGIAATVTLAHSSRVRGLSLLRGRLLSVSGGAAALSHQNDLAVWDPERGRLLGRALPRAEFFHSVDVSPGGVLVSAGGERAELWALEGIPGLLEDSD